jgi:hypothetical protein
VDFRAVLLMILSSPMMNSYLKKVDGYATQLITCVGYLMYLGVSSFCSLSSLTLISLVT